MNESCQWKIHTIAAKTTYLIHTSYILFLSLHFSYISGIYFEFQILKKCVDEATHTYTYFIKGIMILSAKATKR